MARYTAKYQAEGDRVRQDNVLSMCLIIYCALSVVLLGAGWLLYCNLDGIFSRSLTEHELSQAKVMFVILLGSVCATILGRAFVGVNAGYGRFVFSRTVEICCVVSKVGVVAAVLALGNGAIGVVVVEAMINVAILALNAAYAALFLGAHFRLHYWDWALLRELAAFALWVFVVSVVVQINFRLGHFVLGLMTTTRVVAVYAVAMQLAMVYGAFAQVIPSVFLPRTTELVARGASGDHLTRFVIGPCRFQLVLLGCFFGGIVLFGRQFITLWAGPTFIEAWTVAVLVLGPLTIPLFENTVQVILYVKALNRTRALINLAIAVANGVISVLLVRAYGLYGPAIGTACALLVGHGVALNLYYHYGVGVNVPLLFRGTCKGILPVIMMSLGVGIGIVFLPVGHGWIGLAVRCLLYFMFYSVLMWFRGMHERERAFVRSAFRDGKNALLRQDTSIQ